MGFGVGSDFINALMTPYGTTTFVKGETSESIATAGVYNANLSFARQTPLVPIDPMLT